jgi:hypothetical protein
MTQPANASLRPVMALRFYSVLGFGPRRFGRGSRPVRAAARSSHEVESHIAGRRHQARPLVHREATFSGRLACNASPTQTDRARREPDMNSVGRPDAANRHVRFSEQRRETEPLAKPQRCRALPRLCFGSPTGFRRSVTSTEWHIGEDRAVRLRSLSLDEARARPLCPGRSPGNC